MRVFLKRVLGLIFLTVVFVLVLEGLFGFSVLASDQGIMELKTLITPAKAYESMSEDSPVLEDLKQGDSFLVTSHEGEWFGILYEGKQLYLHGDENELFETHIDATAANELTKQTEENTAWIESYVTQTNALRSAKIWRIVIICLIALVIGVIAFKSIHGQNKGKAATDNAGDAK